MKYAIYLMGRWRHYLRGNKGDVDKVIEWSKMGPENARVDDVKTDYLQYEENLVILSFNMMNPGFFIYFT